MTTLHRWIWCLVIAFWLPGSLTARADMGSGATVTIASGAIRGVDGAVRVFRGVPFARAPVGALRWQPPLAPAAWTGMRDATRFGAACMQGGGRTQIGSEDCLFLNVWTPSHRAGDRLPVMVFIHGGAFVGGSGGLSLYEGTPLARKGVVVVTLNYRLGVFGFLAHPALTAESPRHSSGNYGLLDQIAALQWVRGNIAAFGGDPGQVTVFGESAGGTSVAMLLVSPLAHGLFAHAIAESPALGWRFATLQQAEQTGSVLGPDLAALRQMPAATLLEATLRIAPLNPRLAPAPYPYPIVDGWVVPGQPNGLLAAGPANTVPLITGNNADEGPMFAGAWQRLDGVAAYRAKIRDGFGTMADEALRVYPAAGAAQVGRAGADIMGDGIFYEGTRLLAGSLARAGAPSFRYLFTRASGHVPLHSDELRYVFGTLGSAGMTHQATADADDRAVSELMMEAWVRFARTGDPNGGSLPHWNRVGASGDPLLVLDTVPHPMDTYREPQLDFMARFFGGRSR